MSFRPFSAHPRLWLASAVGGGLLALGWTGFETVSRSDWLRDRIRAALVRELESVTGGTVSIQDLRFGDHRLSLEIFGLEVRSAGDVDVPPLLTVPEVSVTLGWRSFLGSQTHLEDLRARDPVIHLSIGDDSESNLPEPTFPRGFPKLAIRRFELSGGKLVWNGRPFEAGFGGSELEVGVTFDPERDAYQVEATLSDPRWGAESPFPPPAGSAAVSAVISDSGIEITDLALRADAFDLAARGIVHDPGSPRAEGSFSVNARIETVAAWLASLQAGVTGALRVDGDFHWDVARGGVRYEGTVAATGVTVEGAAAEAEFVADFSGDVNVVELSGFAGNVFGGDLAGSARILNPWSTPMLSAEAVVTGIEMVKLGAAMHVEALPWDAAADLAINAAGSRSEGFTSELELAIRPQFGEGKLTLEGGGTLRYSSRDDAITVPQLWLATPDARIELSGTFPLAQAGHAEIEASIGSGRALEQILKSVWMPAGLPDSAPDGNYSFVGSARSQLSQIRNTVLSGEFRIEDFLVGGERWEQISLYGEVSPTRIAVRQGHLMDGRGRLDLRGTLPLRSDGALRLSVSASEMNASKIARASGFGLPIDGSLSMDLELWGSPEAPVAEGRLAVETPRFFTERFDRLSAGVLYGPAGFELRDAYLIRGDSTLHASASVNPVDQQIGIDIASTRWPIAGFDLIRTLDPGLSGTVRFDVRGTGKLGGSELLRTLRLEGDWEIADLQRDDLQLGHWRGALRSGKEHQSLEFDLDAEAFGGAVVGRAVLWQVEPTSYSGNFDYHNLNPGDLAALVDLPGDAFEGGMTGRASFGGVVGMSDTFEVNGTVERAELRLPDNDSGVISNVFPMRWGIKSGLLRFDSMNFSAPGTDFELDGSIAIRGDRSLDLGLEGTFNLALLEDVLGGAEVTGSSNVSARLTGTLGEPTLEGSLEVLGATLQRAGNPIRLSDIRGTITVRDNFGKIEELSAASGGGTLRFTGATVYRDESLEYRLHATAEDVRVDYPRNISSVIDGQFTLTGAGSQSILDGDVLVSRMSTAENLSFADLFASLEEPEGDQGNAPMLQDIQVNVHVGNISQLPVETSLVRDVEVDFDLQVVGTVARPSVLGTVGIAQGELRMLGTHYHINRGDLRFVNPLQAEPVLNVELETRIRDVDIALVLSGPASSLNLSYRSDPPLPFHDLVNLVAVGKEPTTDPSIASRTRIEQQSLVQTGADNLLSQAIARPVSRRLQRFFGVSRLKVDPQIGGLEANPSARISTEQQITDDITLIYSYDLSSAQQQAIRIEWTPNRKLSFIVTRDQNGLVGSDVLYKVRLR